LIDWTKEVVSNGWTRKFREWPKELFGWKYVEIMDFIKNRFQETYNKSEYYICIPYLIGSISGDILALRFEDRKSGRLELPRDGKKSSGTNVNIDLPCLNEHQTDVCELRGI
jgi:hypothetical protein